jgi:hypothetical protein
MKMGVTTKSRQKTVRKYWSILESPSTLMVSLPRYVLGDDHEIHPRRPMLTLSARKTPPLHPGSHNDLMKMGVTTKSRKKTVRKYWSILEPPLALLVSSGCGLLRDDLVEQDVLRPDVPGLATGSGPTCPGGEQVRSLAGHARGLPHSAARASGRYRTARGGTCASRRVKASA